VRKKRREEQITPANAGGLIAASLRLLAFVINSRRHQRAFIRELRRSKRAIDDAAAGSLSFAARGEIHESACKARSFELTPSGISLFQVGEKKEENFE